jgi:hypothetical protein
LLRWNSTTHNYICFNNNLNELFQYFAVTLKYYKWVSTEYQCLFLFCSNAQYLLFLCFSNLLQDLSQVLPINHTHWHCIVYQTTTVPNVDCCFYLITSENPEIDTCFFDCCNCLTYIIL